MLRSLLILVALFAITFSAQAAERVSGVVSTKVLPKYVLGNANVAHNEGVLHTNALLKMSNGVYVDIFNSKSLSGAEYGNEVDATLGYATLLDKDRAIGINIGASYFALAPVLDTTRGDIFKPYIELNKKFSNGIAPYIKIEEYFVMGDDAPPAKTRSSIGARHAWQITDKVKLSQNIGGVYEYSPVAGVSCVIARHSAALSWNVFEQASIDILAETFIPLSGRNKEKNFVPGIGLTYRF